MTPLAPIQPRYLRDQAFAEPARGDRLGRLAPGEPLVIDASRDLRAQLDAGARGGQAPRRPTASSRSFPAAPTASRRSREQTALDVLGVMEVLMVRRLRARRARAATPDGVGAMRAALDRAATHAAAGDLIEALAGIHAMHEIVYAATGNPEFGRVLSTIGPRFDRVLYLWYTRVDRRRRELLPARPRRRARARRARRGGRDHAPRLAPLPRGRRRARRRGGDA